MHPATTLWLQSETRLVASTDTRDTPQACVTPAGPCARPIYGRNRKENQWAGKCAVDRQKNYRHLSTLPFNGLHRQWRSDRLRGPQPQLLVGISFLFLKPLLHIFAILPQTRILPPVLSLYGRLLFSLHNKNGHQLSAFPNHGPIFTCIPVRSPVPSPFQG